MAVLTGRVFQIVGYKNSGKTTLTEKLIQKLTKKGYSVGAIKNHGHGGKLKKPEGTDSERHLDAGAQVGAVIGDGEWILSIHKTEFSLTDLLNQYEQLGVDIVLIEGMKKEHYPKIALIRNEEDLELLNQVTNVIAIGGWQEAPIETDLLHFTIDGIDENDTELLNLLTSR